MSHTYFIPHGGGPMPLLSPETHESMLQFFRKISIDNVPDAIVIISAHYETNPIEVIYQPNPTLTYDYYGFPAESYRYQYPAPHDVALGNEIVKALKNRRIEVKEGNRGFDHGVFVPLLVMYPEHSIPVIQVSLHKNLDPAFHIEVGNALSFLKERNVLIIGSGYSFHNLRALMTQSVDERNDAFQDRLSSTISKEMKEETRRSLLEDWYQAPGARYAHPRSEHLIPLHVCYGIHQSKGEVVFDDTIYGSRAIGIKW